MLKISKTRQRFSRKRTSWNKRWEIDENWIKCDDREMDLEGDRNWIRWIYSHQGNYTITLGGNGKVREGKIKDEKNS